MSTKNKAIVRRLFQEALDGGNVDIIDELVSPEFVDHSAAPGAPNTREAWKQGMADLRAAFPDSELSIEQEIAEDDLVTTRFTARGTHQGELMGIPATGKKVTVSGIQIARVAGGKIVERWEQVDTMGMMVQLGVVPAPGG
jgi:steroid delta-isomerase-like uncharacterized protein